MSDLTPAAAPALRFLLGQEAQPFPTEPTMPPTRPPKLNTPRLRAALADAGLPVEDQPSDRTLQRWIYGHAMPPSWAVAAVILRALGTRTLDEALAEMVAREAP